MRTNAELKQVRALHQKKYRVQQGLFLVQGQKLVKELLGSGWRVERLYATTGAATTMGLRDAIVLPQHEMDRLGTLESGNELVAVVPMPAPAAYGTLRPDELVLALDGITDPGNLGTVLRIADWFGVGRVICSTESVEVWNPKCVQSSMGAIFRVAVQYTDLAPELERMRAGGASLYLASMEGRQVFSIPLERPAVLVLGSESHGLSAPVLGMGGVAISVPRVGGAESLNVAMAAAALCMEFTRQRV